MSMSGKQKATRPFSLRTHRRTLWMIFSLMAFVSLAPLGFLTSRVLAANGDLTVTVYNDNNRNGIFDGPDTPLGGATVQVYNAANRSIRNSNTSALTGQVIFTLLTVGEQYRLEVTDIGANNVVSVPGSGNVGLVSFFTAGVGGNTFRVGLRTLSGSPPTDPGAPVPDKRTVITRVWQDLDGDGNQDANEPGFTGLTVVVVNSIGALQATATPLGDGRYLFLDSVPSGSGFRIQIAAVPAGYRLTYNNVDDAGLDNPNIRDSDGVSSGGLVQAALPANTPTFPLPEGANVEDVDIGFARGSISGFVWRDLDGNGLRDSGEPKLNGITVNLFENGVQISTKTTAPRPGLIGSDNLGFYEFSDLNFTSTYSVRIPSTEFDDPADPLFGSASPANVAGGDRGLVNGTDATLTIVDPGEFTSTNADFTTVPFGKTRPQSADKTANFGFFLGSITGRVFFDLNRNGTLDALEPPVENVVMCIDSDADDSCVGESTTVTNASGVYLFDDLPFGIQVRVAMSEVNFILGGRLEGLGVSEPIVTAVAVGAFNPGFAYRDQAAIPLGSPDVVDFNLGVRRAEVGNFVFDDLNGNGVFDELPSAGLAGVRVTLYDTIDGVANGNDAVVFSTTTSITGVYTLTNLLGNRNYYAAFQLSAAQQSAGYVLSTIQPAGYPGVDAPAATTDDINDIQFDPIDPPGGLFRTDVFTITAGSQNRGVDAAAFKPVQVTGKVFFDTNDDDQDLGGAEPGMANLAVSLTSLGPDNTIGTGDDRVYSTTTISATDATNGSYAFTSTLGIPPGSVLITVTNPLVTSFQFVDPDVGADTTDSDVDASGTLTSTVTLVSGTSADFDAGLTGLASLSGRSFLDDNGDGLSSGDADLPGVTVTLDFALNYPAYNLFGVSVVRPAVTAATYTFLNLPDGVFDLSFAAPDATYLPTIDDVGNPSLIDSDGATTGLDRLLDQPFVGSTAQTRDKGFVQLIDISGRAFYDENANDVDDVESGLTGLLVTLYRPGADGVVSFGGDDITSTLTTDVNGAYVFVNQTPGDYGVAFENPASAGFDFVTANQGGDDAVDSDVTNLLLGQTDVLSGTSNVDESDVDAGYIGNGEVSGYTFEDVNGNGLQSVADTNLAGVIVTLALDPAFDGLNLTFPTQTTGPTGIYSFTNLPAGLFDLSFAAPAVPAYQPTFADVGSQPSLIDSDGVLTGIDQLADQALAPEAIEDRDQGYVVPIDISGRAFYDLARPTANLDEAGETEPGLAGLSVTLLRPGADSNFNTTDDVSATLTTDTTGAYTFANQVPGDFIVQFANPVTAGFDFVLADQGLDTLDSDVTNLPLGQTSVLTATSGAAVADVDAGYIGNAEVNGNTFIDGTRDGLSGTTGDGPLAVVNVALTFTPSFTGLTLPAFPAETSDATGIYSFTNLPAGTFSLVFTPPPALPAYQVTVADVITPASLIDSDGTGTDADQLTTQSLAAEGIEERDQGYVVPVTISGRAFYDLARPTANLDEAGETEPGLAGLTVTLIQPGPNGVFDLVLISDDIVTPDITEVTTGAYSFTNVAPGPFIVAFENDPADGFDFALANQGDDKLDSDVTNPQTGGGATSIITATSGTDIADVDAGYIGNSALGGYTFSDGTRDGLSDTTGDTALAGVDVELTFTPSFAGGLSLGLIPNQLSDATGIYSFTNLPAGTFSLVFTPPLALPAYQVTQEDVGPQPATNDSDGLNVVDGRAGSLLANTDAERDQGYVVPVTISGRAFYDLNNDATDEAAPEPGLAGLTVTLYQPDGDGTIDFTLGEVVGTTTTDATGFYTFSNQLPGLYAVQFENPGTAGFDFVTAAQGGDAVLDSDVTDLVNGRTTTATASSGVDVGDVDAGYIGNAAVGGYTFNDGTADGLSNTSGDGPLAGVDVALTFTPSFVGGLNLGLIPNQLSDATGIYSFTNLPAGTFSLVFTPPNATYIVTTPDVGADDTIDSDSDLVNQFLAPNTDAERDQGYYVSITISGRAFYDLARPTANLDEVGETEPGLAGLTVTLVQPGPNGVFDLVPLSDDIVTPDTTEATTGAYSFTNVLPGPFIVAFENGPLDGFDFVLANQGLDTLDSDVTTVQVGGGATSIITATSGTDIADVDAGYIGNAAVGGYTFNDGTADGLSNTSGDGPLAGVDVALTFTPSFAGLSLGTIPNQLSDATGIYSFTNLPAGTFSLVFTPPNATYIVTTPDVGADDTIDSDANLVGQSLGANTDAERDQGYFVRINISGRVFFDENGNDIDDGEVGLEGLNVTLYLAGLNGIVEFGGVDDVFSTTLTNATGAYTFTDQPPQQFAIEVENPVGANFVFVTPNIGDDDAIDSDITDTVNGQTAPIAPASGVDQVDIDAGLRGQATVSGYTFVDGEYDGQSGGPNDSNLAGVTVVISLDPTLDGLPNIDVDQVTTASGVYSFTGLPAGTFSLFFDPPTTTPIYQPTLSDIGDQATDSDGNDVGTDRLLEQPLVVGTPEKRNQGYYQQARITARVFDELVNVDNSFQVGEAGIEQISVDLDNLDGPAPIITRETDATGVVTFNVVPGNYALIIPVDPATYQPSPGNTGNVIVIPAPLLSGQSSLTDNAGKNSFGYYKNSTVSSSVWFDADGDGLLDLGEPGMEGITVTLVLDTDGVAGGDLDLEVATSDVNGLLNFTTSVTPTAIVGPNARYRLRFSERAGFAFTTFGGPITDDDESDAGLGGLTDGFIVGSNSVLDFIDAGYIGALTVGDLVWEDSNANGLQDSGEQALPDAVVTVSVTTTGGLINSTNPTFVLSTTSTASVGLAPNYSFDNLPPGSGVSATSVTIFGYALSLSDQGGNDALDSDPVPSLSPTLAPTDTLDFGLYQTASIGDRVWLDVNGNQLYDMGTDVGFPGVVVQLLDADGAVLAQTTSATNGDIGFYQFTNIIPGTYAVQFNKPTGFDFVNDSAGFIATNNDNDAGLNGRTENFVVPSGQSLPTIDAGLKGSAAINGIVWRDENGNSVRDASDTIRFSGLGVTLAFTPTNVAYPPFTISTTTAADGSYSFVGLPPGSYRVSFGTPGGFVPVAANVGGDDTIDSDGPVASGSLAASATAIIDQGFQIPSIRLFLPMMIQNPTRPDLVVVSIAVAPASPQAGELAEVSVTVRNQGTSAASNFWVDFYINPARLPQVNDPWNEICDPALLASNQCYGIAWFYEGTLQPGESVVLVSRPQDAANPTGYRSASSIWPGYFAPGSTQLYAIVDSWNRSSDGGVRDPNGAVVESNEANNRTEQQIVLTPGQVQTRVPNRQLPADLSSRRFNP